jgi:hypothetical protein
MSYEDVKVRLIMKITAQKKIYKFRMFLYSLNRGVREDCFAISRDYLNNELQNPLVTATERERIQRLLLHWQWNTFDTTSTLWWTRLSTEHNSSLSLMTLINLWIDDIHTFDPENFETATDGLR